MLGAENNKLERCPDSNVLLTQKTTSYKDSEIRSGILSAEVRTLAKYIDATLDKNIHSPPQFPLRLLCS